MALKSQEYAQSEANTTEVVFVYTFVLYVFVTW